MTNEGDVPLIVDGKQPTISRTLVFDRGYRIAGRLEIINSEGGQDGGFTSLRLIGDRFDVVASTDESGAFVFGGLVEGEFLYYSKSLDASRGA